MGIEIERKFLVVSDAWRGQVWKTLDMAQGYLNDSQAVGPRPSHALQL